MSDNSKSKTLHYLRSVHDGQPRNIEASIRLMLRRRRVCKDTELDPGDQSIMRIQHRRVSTSNNPVLLHLVKYVPGEKAATLDPEPEGAEDEEGAQRPPRGKEFKAGECFMLVNDADVIFCASGITQAAARVYFRQFFAECGVEKEMCLFDLLPAADLDRLAIIRKHGVGSIQLGSVAYEASRKLLPDNSTMGRRLLKSVSDQVAALVAKDDTVLEQRAMEDLIVNVELKLQGNTHADIEAQRSIDKIAVAMLSDEQGSEGFTIVTRDGNRLSDLSVKLHKRIKVTSYNNSVEHTSVWTALSNYYDELKEGKLLET
ncbi:hypothetical protein [Granulosicoccus antarcticus]|uniref:Uncharacterized protein n=1 Tax=Granulosicoccus antarcticus IMCC3135 TaxID=1192854 RepID=A0A2Z2NLS5_9GAMM|nr:hypothetical protein [Granulosicoccus antarcticus]ASJ72286.1 hypothetical protein IMCC3135_10970 [Granulosicoccus antarcticus IMCC3135]